MLCPWTDEASSVSAWAEYGPERLGREGRAALRGRRLLAGLNDPEALEDDCEWVWLFCPSAPPPPDSESAASLAGRRRRYDEFVAETDRVGSCRVGGSSGGGRCAPAGIRRASSGRGRRRDPVPASADLAPQRLCQPLGQHQPAALPLQRRHRSADLRRLV